MLGRRPPPEPVWTRDALAALLGALFDIRRELIWIHEFLEDGDESEETEETPDDS